MTDCGTCVRVVVMHTIGLMVVASQLVAATEDIALIDAVKAGHSDAIRTAIAERGDVVNASEGDGTTALHWASFLGNVEAAELLIAAGADVNRVNALGVTALHLAGVNGDGAMVQRLLEAGADPNSALPSGESALMTAARTGAGAAVEALLDGGADPDAIEDNRGQTALMWAAAQGGHPDVVSLLIERGADVNARSHVRRVLVNRSDGFNNALRAESPRTAIVEMGGYTALLFAARNGHLDSARKLVAGGADPNDKAADGTTALLVAIHSGQPMVASWLLETGADPNGSNAGYDALHAAVLRGNLHLVNELILYGADIDARLQHGTQMTRYGDAYALPNAFTGATPLFLASRVGEVEMIESLLEAGADVELGVDGSTTPIMQAAGVRLDPGGWRPAEGISLEREEAVAAEIIDRLQLAGADPTVANDAGDTALHGAVRRRLRAVIPILVRRGATIDAVNKQGETPLSIASGLARGGSDQEDIVGILRDAASATR